MSVVVVVLVVIPLLGRFRLGVATTVGLIGAALMAVRLLVPAPVGMANNGDAGRLMCHIGADAGGPPSQSGAWWYARFQYMAVQPHTPCMHYRTLQIIQLAITAQLHRLLGQLFGFSDVIDIRELIVEDSLLAGLAMAVLVWLLRSVRLRYRLALAAIFFLVLADATFADYAASPFSEPAALMGMITVALSAVAVIAGRSEKRLAFLVLWVGSVLLIGAKAQSVSLLVPLAMLIGAQRLPVGRPGRAHARDARFVRILRDRAVPLIAAASLVPVAMWVSGAAAGDLGTANVGNEITLTIMPLAKDPGQVAVDLGMPRSFSAYEGTTWWGLHGVWSDALYPQYADKFTRANLAHYLLQHPTLDRRVLSYGASQYYTMRAARLASYPLGAGYRPSRRECRVCVVTDIAQRFRDAGLAGIVIYWVTSLALAAGLWRRSVPGSLRRGFATVSFFLVTSAILQFLTAAFGDGDELTKHMVISIAAATLTALWLLAALVSPSLGLTLPTQRRPERAVRHPLAAPALLCAALAVCATGNRLETSRSRPTGDGPRRR